MKNKLPEVGKRYKLSWDVRGDVKVVYINNYYIVVEYDDGYCESFEHGTGETDFWGYFEELPDQEPTAEEMILKHSAANAYMKARQGQASILQGKSPTTEESSIVDKKVKEAFEKVKEDLDRWHKDGLDELFDFEDRGGLLDSITYLINALEENPLVNPTTQETPVSSIVEQVREDCVYCGNKSDEFTKEGCCSYSCQKNYKEIVALAPSEEKKSIWKPVSELPKFCCDVVIKFAKDDICFATFSDDTNQFFMISEMKGPVCIAPPMEYARLTDFINSHDNLEKRIERLEQLTKEK